MQCIAASRLLSRTFRVYNNERNSEEEIMTTFTINLQDETVIRLKELANKAGAALE